MCVYPTTKTAYRAGDEQRRVRMNLVDLDGGAKIASRKFDLDSLRCVGNNCKTVKGSIFSRRCSWTKVDVAASVRAALAAKPARTHIVLSAQLQSLSCINGKTSSPTACLSWHGGHQPKSTPLRFHPFMLVHYGLFSNYSVVAGEAHSARNITKGCPAEGQPRRVLQNGQENTTHGPKEEVWSASSHRRCPGLRGQSANESQAHHQETDQHHHLRRLLRTGRESDLQ